MWAHKIYWFLILFGVAHVAYSEVAQPPPDAEAWVESLNQDQLMDLKIPRVILVLESPIREKLESSEIKPLHFDYGLCHEMSYLMCVNGDDFSYALLINKLPPKPTIDELMKLSAADGMIYSDGAQILFRGRGEIHDVSLAKAKRFAKNFEPRKLLDRLLHVLGYDGVVLDVRGEFILVGTFKYRLKHADAQGLLIKNSSDRLVLGSDITREGAALITLVGQHQGYAVFRSVISAASTVITKGQKVILEERH